MVSIPVYFVRADNEDGESLDLLVIAKTKDQAVDLWGDYFEHQSATGVKPMWARPVPGVTADAPIGAIPWSSISPPDPMPVRASD